MKINEPVTGVEKEVDEQCVLLTTTDVKGQITYTNQEFIDMSGFSREELIGKAHNIVRHPDMPPAAFADMWKTVQSGMSWMGIVKNRCKNGDHYWVNAFVSPIKRNGQIVEYQSIRTKADRNDIKRAESLYKKLGKSQSFAAQNKLQLSVVARLQLLGLLTTGLPAGLLIWSSELPAFWTIIASVIAVGGIVSGQLFLMRRFDYALNYARSVVKNPLLKQVYTGSNDENGDFLLAMKMLKTQINALAGRFYDTAQQLQTNATDLSNSVALTDQGANHQKTEIGTLTFSMEEMLSTAHNVSTSAHEASQAAQEADDSAKHGRQIVTETIDSINTLADQVEQSVSVIKQLAIDSDNIGTILDVIKGIAEQTNLLALNAAIEAARAGEQGRGFAVVADEVRSLASRTHESTQEIENMIQRLQQSAQNATETMEGGHNNAQNCVKQVISAGDSLNKITTAVDRIKDMNTQIASAAEQQSAVTADVKNNVEVIDEVSELTTETLQGMSVNSENTRKIADVLNDLSDYFKQQHTAQSKITKS